MNWYIISFTGIWWENMNYWIIWNFDLSTVTVFNPAMKMNVPDFTAIHPILVETFYWQPKMATVHHAKIRANESVRTFEQIQWYESAYVGQNHKHNVPYCSVLVAYSVRLAPFLSSAFSTSLPACIVQSLAFPCWSNLCVLGINSAIQWGAAVST